MVLTVDWLWPCDVLSLQYSPTTIQRSYYCPCSSTLLDWYLAVFFIPTLSSSGYTVVMMYIILCALSYIRVFYTFFYCLVQPMYWADYFFGIFMFFGTLSEYKLTRISYIWFDSTKFLPCNGFPSCPCCWHMTSVIWFYPWSYGVVVMGLALEEWVCNSNKKRGNILSNTLKSTENLRRFL